MERKRLVVNYNNVSTDVMEAIRKKYPLGYTNHVIKVQTKGEDFSMQSLLIQMMPATLLKCLLKLILKE